MFSLLFLIYFALCNISFNKAIRELCHPQCYIKCLPSCTCCDSKQQQSNTFDVFKRNEIRLKNLGRMLMERDLIVGFSCDPYCQKRCVPSCKFSCCGTNEQAAGNSLYTYHENKNAGKSEFSLKKLVKAIEATQSEYMKLKDYISKINATIQSEENLPEAVTFNADIKMPELSTTSETKTDISEIDNKLVKNHNLKVHDRKSPAAYEMIKQSEAAPKVLSENKSSRKKKDPLVKPTDDNTANNVYQTIQTLQEKIDAEVKRRKLKKPKPERKKKIIKNKKHEYLVGKLKALMDAKDKLKTEFLKTTNFDKISSFQKIDEELEKAAKAYELIKLHDNAIQKFGKSKKKIYTGSLFDKNQPALKEVLGNIEAGHNSVILEVIDGSGTQLSEIRVKKSKKHKKRKKKHKHHKKKLKHKKSESTKKKIENLLKSSSCSEEICKDEYVNPCCESYLKSTTMDHLPGQQNQQPNYWSSYHQNFAPISNDTTQSFTKNNAINYYSDSKNTQFGYFPNASVPNNAAAMTNQYGYNSIASKENQPAVPNALSLLQLPNQLAQQAYSTPNNVTMTTGRRTDTPDDTKQQIQTLISLLQNTMKQIDGKQINDTSAHACSDDCKKQCLPDCHFMCC